MFGEKSAIYRTTKAANYLVIRLLLQLIVRFNTDNTNDNYFRRHCMQYRAILRIR